MMTEGERPGEARLVVEEAAVAERQAPLETRLAEFRAAQQRRLVKQGMALWNQTEAAYRAAHAAGPAPPRRH